LPNIGANTESEVIIAKHDDEFDGLSGAHGLLSSIFGGGFPNADGFRTGNDSPDPFGLYGATLFEADTIDFD
jgi:hypothetical protein